MPAKSVLARWKHEPKDADGLQENKSSIAYISRRNKNNANSTVGRLQRSFSDDGGIVPDAFKKRASTTNAVSRLQRSYSDDGGVVPDAFKKRTSNVPITAATTKSTATIAPSALPFQEEDSQTRTKGETDGTKAQPTTTITIAPSTTTSGTDPEPTSESNNDQTPPRTTAVSTTTTKTETITTTTPPMVTITTPVSSPRAPPKAKAYSPATTRKMLTPIRVKSPIKPLKKKLVRLTSAEERAKGNNIYLMSEEHVWLPGQFLKLEDDSGGKKATISVQQFENEQEILTNVPVKRRAGGGYSKPAKQVSVDLTKYENKSLPLQNCDAQGLLNDYEDMVNLPHLHEAAILYNLKQRHIQGVPYTRTGDIIIAVNPYKWFQKIYTDEKKDFYSRSMVWEIADCDPRTYLSPHVYEVSSLSFKGMAIEGIDQSILVSGESGAGKTETVKICMDHIACVQHGPEGSKCRDDAKSALILEMVLQTSPLLEAFGYSKTRKNDNSSRFGKYTQLQFDTTSQFLTVTPAKLAGSTCNVYLLEKNRVIAHDSRERTFHIFYQLLTLPNAEKEKIWQGLSNTTTESFVYVGHSDPNVRVSGMSDHEHWSKHTLKALQLLNISGEQYYTLMRSICIVLQLGNIRFERDRQSDDKCHITATKQELIDLAPLMGVDEDSLYSVLTERTMETNNESFKVPLNADNAREACNSFAKEIYGKVFVWLVRTINAATRGEDNYEDGSVREFRTIGLLDIFGFEVFGVNRFEQLCINYANEKLQQKFVQDIFQSVKLEYEKEGIPLSEVTFDENTDVLDLIEGRTGLLAMLNEECIRPKGNSETFVAKAFEMNSKSPCLIMDSMDRLNFGIRHFAANVMYDAESFVSRNKDTLPDDQTHFAIKCSNNSIMSSEFRLAADEEAARINNAQQKSRFGGRSRQKSFIVSPTVWTKYKEQLTDLMGALRKTRSRYIRCIKPNSLKKPVLMEHKMTIDQLRAAGVVAGVLISRSAFPNHLINTSVIARYSSMWDKEEFPAKTIHGDPEEQLRENCRALLSCALKDFEVFDSKKNKISTFAVGNTKTYFRSGALEYLENIRLSGLEPHAVTIQKYTRRWITENSLHDRRQQELEEKRKREREEQARWERLQREAQERALARDRDNQQYRDQIAALEKQIKDVNENKENDIENAKKRAEEAKRMKEEYMEQTRDSMRIDADDEKLKRDASRSLADDEKEINALKKEREKLRKKLEKLKKMYEQQQRLLNQLNNEKTAYEKAMDRLEQLRLRKEALKTESDITLEQQRDMTKDLQRLQKSYMNLTERRLEYKKALLRIMSLIKTHSKQEGLIAVTSKIAKQTEIDTNHTLKDVESKYEFKSSYQGYSNQ